MKLLRGCGWFFFGSMAVVVMVMELVCYGGSCRGNYVVVVLISSNLII